MRFLRKIASILGFLRDENHDGNDGDHVENDGVNGLPRKGFSVQVPIPVERVYQGPVISQCNLGEGGVQGLKWYTRRLRIDEDGDVADEFFDEVILPKPSGTGSVTKQHKFQVKYSAKPAVVRSQVIAIDGTIHQSVEYKGRLQWV